MAEHAAMPGSALNLPTDQIFVACPLPRYGMWFIFIPVTDASSAAKSVAACRARRRGVNRLAGRAFT